MIGKLKELLYDLFFSRLYINRKWNPVTGQNPNFEAGIPAQHLVSFLTGIKGTGRLLGADLSDGSEVKSSFISDQSGTFNNRNYWSKWTFHNIRLIPTYPFIYGVVFMEFEYNYTIRIWKMDLKLHSGFRLRCEDLLKTGKDMQLQAPGFYDTESYVKHGGIYSRKTNRYPILKIPLESDFSTKILDARGKDALSLNIWIHPEISKIHQRPKLELVQFTKPLVIPNIDGPFYMGSKKVA
jgi:hypothetical protein